MNQNVQHTVPFTTMQGHMERFSFGGIPERQASGEQLEEWVQKLVPQSKSFTGIGTTLVIMLS